MKRKLAFKDSNDSGNARFKMFNEKKAAQYVGEKLSVFRQLVKKGLIPKSIITWYGSYNRNHDEEVYYGDKLDIYIESKKRDL